MSWTSGGENWFFFTSYAHHIHLIRMTCQSYTRESVLYMWFIAVWNVLHMCTRVQKSLIFFFLLFVMKTKPDDEVNSTSYITYILLQSKGERVRSIFSLSLSIISSNISIVFNCVSFFLSSWSSPGNDTVE